MARLLTLAGVFFIMAGGLFLFPLIRDELQPIPAPFGEAQPVLRPIVTPRGLPDALPQTSEISTIPTRIVIPAIHLDAPIESVGWSQVNDGSTWNIPDHFAAGWLKTSAPLGQSGNTVLDGHHNMAGEVFRYLVDLEPGDVIEVYAGDRRLQFAVTALHILRDRDQPIGVRRQNAAWIQPTADERLTLVTCWPYTNNTHRLIVVAQPITVGDHPAGLSTSAAP